MPIVEVDPNYLTEDRAVYQPNVETPLDGSIPFYILDSGHFLICAAILVIYRNRWWAPIASIFISTILGETILTVTQNTKNWGDGFGTQLLIASVATLMCKLLLWLNNEYCKEKLGSNTPLPPKDL